MPPGETRHGMNQNSSTGGNSNFKQWMNVQCDACINIFTPMEFACNEA